MRILVVEDDREVARFIERGLKEAGHTVDLASDGRDGLFLAMSEPYQAVVLDRMLPHVDGLAILRALRGSSIDTPVLILSALGDVDDRVAGPARGRGRLPRQAVRGERARRATRGPAAAGLGEHHPVPSPCCA